MKKLLLVIGTDYQVSLIIKYQLLQIVGDLFEITTCSVEDIGDMVIKVDGIVVSDACLIDQIQDKISPETKIFTLIYTISREGLMKLNDLPVTDKYYVANINLSEELDTINLLHRLGFGKLMFLPYHGENPADPSIMTVITPNEMSYVPSNFNTVINIGDRQIDDIMLFNLLSGLNMLNAEISKNLLRYMMDTVPRAPGLKHYFEMISEHNYEHKFLLDSMQYGVLSFRNNRVQYVNYAATQLLKHSESELMNQNIYTIFPSMKQNDSEISCINTEQMRICAIPHYFRDTKTDGVLQVFPEQLILSAFKAMDRTDMLTKSTAKYSFADIVGESKALRKTISLAKVFARSQMPVLITGESGTGKELFAQSIHNASSRSKKPFVAFNCAALTGSIVESELFGYEKSAFTGANRNGKIGLIEYANHGTLFMDEIAELPATTQAMLLRAIQEKEIMRVGGTETIPVDVRIIVATNRDLKQMVREGKFREDLYFRLNALYLYIPPLSERLRDVELIILHYLKQRNIKLTMDADIMRRIRSYSWPGNVRELYNFLDFYLHIYNSDFNEAEKIDYIRDYFIRNEVKSISESDAQKPVVIDQETIRNEILHLLYSVSNEKKGMGRGGILKQMKRKYPTIKEGAVRKALQALREDGFIETRAGRSGSCITEAGIQQIQYMDE